jgi:hypothetical protein
LQSILYQLSISLAIVGSNSCVCDITEFGKPVENNIGEVLLHYCTWFGSIRVDSDMPTKELGNLLNYQDISHFAFSPHYQISYNHPICAVLLSNIHKM